MELKTKKKTIFEVDSADFDDFVNEIYGGNFEFIADHQANNYSSYHFTAPNMNVDFDGKYEDKIRQNKFNGVPVYAIFNVLLKDGHIKKGEYFITVFY